MKRISIVIACFLLMGCAAQNIRKTADSSTIIYNSALEQAELAYQRGDLSDNDVLKIEEIREPAAIQLDRLDYLSGIDSGQVDNDLYIQTWQVFSDLLNQWIEILNQKEGK